jgi:hypothetical protein
MGKMNKKKNCNVTRDNLKKITESNAKLAYFAGAKAYLTEKIMKFS